MEKIWLVVANHTEARILGRNRNGRLVDLETFSFPQAQLPERDILTDSPGRNHDSSGLAHHAMEPHTDIRQQQAQQFSRQLAERMEEGRNANIYDKLVLIAPPDFLGALRNALSKSCRKQVMEECPKNIVGKDTATIIESLSFPLQMALKSSTL